MSRALNLSSRREQSATSSSHKLHWLPHALALTGTKIRFSSLVLDISDCDTRTACFNTKPAEEAPGRSWHDNPRQALMCGCTSAKHNEVHAISSDCQATIFSTKGGTHAENARAFSCCRTTTQISSSLIAETRRENLRPSPFCALVFQCRSAELPGFHRPELADEHRRMRRRVVWSGEQDLKAANRAWHVPPAIRRAESGATPKAMSLETFKLGLHSSLNASRRYPKTWQPGPHATSFWITLPRQAQCANLSSETENANRLPQAQLASFGSQFTLP